MKIQDPTTWAPRLQDLRILEPGTSIPQDQGPAIQNQLPNTLSAIWYALFTII